MMNNNICHRFVPRGVVLIYYYFSKKINLSEYQNVREPHVAMGFVAAAHQMFNGLVWRAGPVCTNPKPSLVLGSKLVRTGLAAKTPNVDSGFGQALTLASRARVLVRCRNESGKLWWGNKLACEGCFRSQFSL
jgi:hypothetical protein